MGTTVRKDGQLEAQPVDEAGLTIRYAESGVYTYIGQAQPGSAITSPVWRMKRIDETSSPDFDVKWADGDKNFDNYWNDGGANTYLTKSYS